MYDFPYLNDSDFLKKFDKLNIKQQLVKITVLSFDEEPIEQIQGKVQSGSINIDGSSSMRRTGSLTIFATEDENDLTNLQNLFSLNKKVQVLIGFKNTTSKYLDYPIIWFPQGVFVIVTPNISYSSTGVSITLTLHDKMALLNGQCGGVFPASVTLHEVEELNDKGQIQISRPTIYQIIQEVMNHFGGEQLGKILISDIDERIKRVMKWTGSTPLYLYIKSQSEAYQFSTNLKDLQKKRKQYGGTIEQFKYGENVGFIMDDFIYTDELVANAGQTVVSVLDKIKDYLGNYEYFYDIRGNFVFQEIKNYLNKSFSASEIENLSPSDYLIDIVGGKSVYTFDDSDIIISYSNAPQYQQIKNDFIVWGKKTSVNGTQRPIRYHLALDKRPQVGNSYKVFFYNDPQDGILKAKKPVEFASKSNFPKKGDGYIFYLALDSGKIYQWNYQKASYVQCQNFKLETITTTDYRTELYMNGVQNQSLGTDSNYYFTELKNEWTKLYDIRKGAFLPQIEKNPEQMDFFLDIIDSPDIQFDVTNIGRRTEAIVDDTVNCIFQPEFPDVVFIKSDTPQTAEIREECIAKNQKYTQVGDSIYSMLLNGGGYKAAFDRIQMELYQYSSYNEQITLTTLPIYYLQPNTRITVRNSETGIFGDYIIKSLSIPLDTAGTMNITCTRAVERS